MSPNSLWSAQPALCPPLPSPSCFRSQCQEDPNQMEPSSHRGPATSSGAQEGPPAPSVYSVKPRAVWSPGEPPTVTPTLSPQGGRFLAGTMSGSWDSVPSRDKKPCRGRQGGGTRPGDLGLQEQECGEQPSPSCQAPSPPGAPLSERELWDRDRNKLRNQEVTGPGSHTMRSGGQPFPKGR